MQIHLPPRSAKNFGLFRPFPGAPHRSPVPHAEHPPASMRRGRPEAFASVSKASSPTILGTKVITICRSSPGLAEGARCGTRAPRSSRPSTAVGGGASRALIPPHGVPAMAHWLWQSRPEAVDIGPNSISLSLSLDTQNALKGGTNLRRHIQARACAQRCPCETLVRQCGPLTRSNAERSNAERYGGDNDRRIIERPHAWPRRRATTATAGGGGAPELRGVVADQQLLERMRAMLQAEWATAPCVSRHHLSSGTQATCNMPTQGRTGRSTRWPAVGKSLLVRGRASRPTGRQPPARPPSAAPPLPPAPQYHSTSPTHRGASAQALRLQ